MKKWKTTGLYIGIAVLFCCLCVGYASLVDSLQITGTVSYEAPSTPPSNVLAGRVDDFSEPYMYYCGILEKVEENSELSDLKAAIQEQLGEPLDLEAFKKAIRADGAVDAVGLLTQEDMQYIERVVSAAYPLLTADAYIQQLLDETGYTLLPELPEPGVILPLFCILAVDSADMVQFGTFDQYPDVATNSVDYSLAETSNAKYLSCPVDEQNTGGLKVYMDRGLMEEESNSDTTVYILTSEELPLGTKIKAPTHAEYLFAAAYNVKEINFGDAFDASECKNLRYLFAECHALETVVFSPDFGAAATDMSSMFESCKSLTSVNLENLHTDNCTDMNRMFNQCKMLESIVMPTGFGGAALGMNSMFAGCTALQTAEMGDGFGGAALDMNSMFAGCTALQIVDMVTGFGSVCLDTHNMFSGCANLQYVEMTAGFGSASENMSYMFMNCYELCDLELPAGFGSQAENMYCMFNGCFALQSMKLPAGFGQEATNMEHLFAMCTGLRDLDISGIKTIKCQSMYSMFSGCKSLTTLNVSSIDISSCTNMGVMFAGCSNLRTIYSNKDWYPMTQSCNMSSMFSNCESLVGGNGTSYAAEKETTPYGCGDGDYAVLDRDGVSGYFTDINAPVPTNVMASRVNNFQLSYHAHLLGLEYVSQKAEENEIMADLLAQMTAAVYIATNSNELDMACLQQGNYVDGSDAYIYTKTVFDTIRPYLMANDDVVAYLHDQSLVLAEFNLQTGVLPDEYLYVMSRAQTVHFGKLVEYNGHVYCIADGVERIIPWNFKSMNVDQYGAGGVKLFYHPDLENMSVAAEYVEDRNIYILLNTDDDQIIAPENAMGLFSNYKTDLTLLGDEHKEKIHFNGMFDTSRTTNAMAMFAGSVLLRSVDGITLTSRCEDMSYMFETCYSLESVDLTSIDASGCENMEWMFYRCESLKELILPEGFGTAAKLMGHMFENCCSLGNLDLPEGFGAVAVNMRALFDCCESFTEIVFPEGSGSQALDVHRMFEQCQSLVCVELPEGFGVKALTVDSLFNLCDKLEEVTLPRGFASNAVDFYQTFSGCPNLTTIYAYEDIYDENRELDYSEHDAGNMFSGVGPLKGGYGTEWATQENQNSWQYALIDREGTPGYLTDFNAARYSNVLLDFARADEDPEAYLPFAAYLAALNQATKIVFQSDLQGIPAEFESVPADIKNSGGVLLYYDPSGTDGAVYYVPGEGYDNIVAPQNATGLFSGFICPLVEQIDFGENVLDTSKVTSMFGMFSYMTNLRELDLQQFDTAQCTDMYAMFAGCYALEKLLLPEGFGSACTNMSRMFDMTSIEGSEVIDVPYSESQLKVLDLSNLDTGSCTDTEYMFDGCLNLTTIYAQKDWNAEGKDIIGSYMFRGCEQLHVKNGTSWQEMSMRDPDHCQSISYANVDTYNDPGYFTVKLLPLTNRMAGITDDFGISYYTYVISCNEVMNAAEEEEDAEEAGEVADNHYRQMLQRLWVVTMSITGDMTQDEIFELVTRYMNDPYNCIYSQEEWQLLHDIFVAWKPIFEADERLSAVIANAGLSYTELPPQGLVMPAEYASVIAQTATKLVFGVYQEHSENVSGMSWFPVDALRTGGVRCYYDAGGQNTVAYILLMPGAGGDKIIAPNNAMSLFAGFAELREIDFGGIFDTSGTVNMTSMFSGCEKLTGLDLSAWDTSSCQYMQEMFCLCRSVSSIVLPEAFGSGCKNMNSLFEGCYSLASLDASKINPQSCLTMNSMFRGCYQLAELDLSGWEEKTALCKDMGYLFASCTNMTTLILPDNFGGASESFAYAFSNCRSLTALPLDKLNTVKCTNMDSMFAGCAGLTTLTIPTGFGGVCQDMSYMFQSCSNLAEIHNLEELNMTGCLKMQGMFAYCTSLTTLRLPDSFGQQCTDAKQMFMYCKNLQRIDMSGWKGAACKNMNGMFQDCTALEELIMPTEAFGGVCEDMSGMFQNCQSLRSLDLTQLDASSCESMHSMFYNCVSLEALILPKENFGNVCKDMSYMFAGCANLTSLDLSGLRGAMCENMSWMFTNCGALKELLMPTESFGGACENMNSMFYQCYQLVKLDLSALDTSSCLDMQSMFSNCSYLDQLILPENFGSACTNMRCMFQHCWNVLYFDLRNLNMASCTDASQMFAECYSVRMIYVDPAQWPLAETVNTQKMFDVCENLAGGKGSTKDLIYRQDPQHALDGTYGCVDTDAHPGYFTDAGEVNVRYTIVTCPLENYDYETLMSLTTAEQKHTLCEVYNQFYLAGSGEFYNRISQAKADTLAWLLENADSCDVSAVYTDFVNRRAAYKEKQGAAAIIHYGRLTDFEAQVANYEFIPADLTGLGVVRMYYGQNSEGENEVYVLVCVEGKKMEFATGLPYANSTWTLKEVYFHPNAIKASDVNNMDWKFGSCHNLEYADLSGLEDLNNRVTFAQTFVNCRNLKTVILPEIQPFSGMSTREMFKGCSALETVYAPASWNLNAAELVSTGMFEGCESLSAKAIVEGVVQRFSFDPNAADGTYARIYDGTEAGGYFTYVVIRQAVEEAIENASGTEEEPGAEEEPGGEEPGTEDPGTELSDNGET